MAKIGRNSSYVYVPQFLRDIRKECTHMKKRFLSIMMALALMLTLVPTAALAADLPQVGEDGFITLTDGAYTLPEDTELSNPIRVAGTATLDLNGYTLSPASGYSSNYLIKVSEGGDLTLTDTGTTGKITTNNATNIRGISNNGTFTMDSGTIEVYSYAIENVVTNESYADDQPVICNIRGGELSASYAWTVLFMGAGMAGQSGSINQGEAGSVRNDLMVVNISGDAKITGDQAITTNASNGIYAGFTLNISGDAEISGGSNTDNCGIYLPAVGVTNISGGTISGDQGIRICAGELNITGGTIEGTGTSNNEDLIAGGSGGTLGAIVVGKASGGYVGDVVVNIDEGAIVENTAEGEGAAIVVSDKHMDDTSMGYDELSIIVNVNGARIDGNVVKVSNVSPGNTADGGNTTLTIQDATVTGNVTNQSQTGLIIRDTTVSGTVSNTSKGSTAVLGESTIGDSSSTGDGTLYVEGDASAETTYYAINERTSKVYTGLNTAISEADDGDTITLLDDIEVSLDGIDNTSGAITINKSITLNGDRNTITATSTGSEKGIAHIIVVSGSEVTIENLNLDGNDQIARYGVQAYGNGVELTLDTVSSFDNYAYGAFANNGATVIADNLTTSGNGWGGVNVDNGGDLTINSGNLSGDTYSVVIEGTENEATLKGGNYNLIQVKTESGETNTLTISGGNYQNIVGSESEGNPVKAETAVTGGNFANSVADVATTPAYEVDKNSGSYPFSYTNNYADAVEAAGPGGEVTAVNAEGTTTYTVTFDYGDSRADTVSTVADDTEITLPDPGTRSGYDFAGWYSGNTRYDEGDQVRITSDMTFTASWSERNTGSSGSDNSEPSYSPVLDVSDGGSVKVNPRTPGEGDEVTITVDPDAGYEVDEVTVTDRSGRDVRVTAERDGTYTFEQPKGRVTIAVTFVREGTSTFFTDVAETYWAYDEIAWAYENGYVNGVTATTFAPGASISRQQIWMILARIAGDDPADMAAARQWSIDNGISDGTNPGSAVTRQQLAALLYRYAQMMGYANEARVDLSSFPDAGSVASYAVEPMQWSVANSIVGGTTDGTLNPTGTATRAQFAVMLYRFWTGV